MVDNINNINIYNPYDKILQKVDSSIKKNVENQKEKESLSTDKDILFSKVKTQPTVITNIDIVSSPTIITQEDIKTWCDALKEKNNINRILKHRSSNEIMTILEEFKKNYPQEWEELYEYFIEHLDTLSDQIREGLYKIDKKLDPDIISWKSTQLHKAMKGVGTNEDIIYKILENSPQKQILEIEKEFERKYGKYWGGGLYNALRDEMSGIELERALRSLERAHNPDIKGSREILEEVIKNGSHTDICYKIGYPELNIATVDEKALLIEKLLTGTTGKEEELFILKILKSCKDKKDKSKMIEKLDKLGRLNQLIDDINGEEYDKLLEILPKMATDKISAEKLISVLANDLNDKNKLAIHHIIDNARLEGFNNQLIDIIKQFKNSPQNLFNKPIKLMEKTLILGNRNFWESIEKLVDPEKLSKLKRPEIIAHRGGPVEFPENTLSSIEAAARRGAGAIEIDICVTGDNNIILWHDYDPTFGFTVATGRNLGLEPGMIFRPTFPNIGSDFRKPIYELDLDTIKRNYGYSGPKGEINNVIPTLNEAIDVLKKYPQIKKIYLDVKLPEDNPDVQKRFSNSLKEIITKNNLKDKIVILHKDGNTIKNLRTFIGKDYNFSFDREDLNSMIDTGIPDVTDKTNENTYVSAGDPQNPFSAYSFKHYVEMLKQAREKVNKGESNQKIIAWTINDELKLRELITIPVDGIMTDDPEGLKIILDKIIK